MNQLLEMNEKARRTEELVEQMERERLGTVHTEQLRMRIPRRKVPNFKWVVDTYFYDVADNIDDKHQRNVPLSLSHSLSVNGSKRP